MAITTLSPRHLPRPLSLGIILRDDSEVDFCVSGLAAIINELSCLSTHDFIHTIRVAALYWGTGMSPPKCDTPLTSSLVTQDAETAYQSVCHGETVSTSVLNR
jgi:hypothetical protein